MNSWERRDCHNFSCVGLARAGVGGGEQQKFTKKLSTNSWPRGICASRTLSLSRNPDSSPELHTQRRDVCGAGRLSTFLRFGNDSGRGKAVGSSEKFKSSTQGSPSPLRDFPGFSKSGQDTPPFQEKLGCRNQCPALAGGPGKREAEVGEGNARHGCGCSQLNPGPNARNYLLYWRKVCH